MFDVPSQSRPNSEEIGPASANSQQHMALTLSPIDLPP